MCLWWSMNEMKKTEKSFDYAITMNIFSNTFDVESLFQPKQKNYTKV